MDSSECSLKRNGDGMATNPFHLKGMGMATCIYVNYKHYIFREACRDAALHFHIAFTRILFIYNVIYTSVNPEYTFRSE